MSYYGPRYRTVFVDSGAYYGPGEVVEEVIYEEEQPPQVVQSPENVEEAPLQPAEGEQPLEEAQPSEKPAAPQPDAENGKAPAADQARKPHPDFQPSVTAFLAGDYEQALKHLDNVVRDEPDNGEAWLATMHANFALGRYGTAANGLAKAAELGAFPRGYQFDPAPLYAKQAGSLDTYLKALDDHIAQKPKDADARLVRAYLHVAKGEKSEARAALDTVLELRPADETAPELVLALLPPPPPPVKGKPIAPPAAKK